MSIQTIVGISDKDRYYKYGVSAIDSQAYIFLPRFRPEKFDQEVDRYTIHISYWEGNFERTLIDKEFDINDALAIAEIKHEEDYYNEYIPLGAISETDKNLYISLKILKEMDGEYIQDMNYNSGQGCIIQKTGAIYFIPCVVPGENDEACLSLKHFPLEELESFMDFDVSWKYKIKIYVVDDVNCYDVYSTGKIDLKKDTELITIPMKTILKKFTTLPEYKPGLKLQANINIYDQNDDIFMTFRSIPYILTPDAYARYLCDSSDDKWDNPDEVEKILDEMNIIKPRIVNQTVTQVVNMQANTDSKGHIVQPVFFRVRDLGNCIFHPQVTENVCINLDYYKSSVESFKLKIEGIIFSETARTNAGVIFKIQGNLLPGELDEGTYYILNESGELITTGKYTYEY